MDKLPKLEDAAITAVCTVVGGALCTAGVQRLMNGEWLGLVALSVGGPLVYAGAKYSQWKVNFPLRRNYLRKLSADLTTLVVMVVFIYFCGPYVLRHVNSESSQPIPLPSLAFSERPIAQPSHLSPVDKLAFGSGVSLTQGFLRLKRPCAIKVTSPIANRQLRKAIADIAKTAVSEPNQINGCDVVDDAVDADPEELASDEKHDYPHEKVILHAAKDNRDAQIIEGYLTGIGMNVDRDSDSWTPPADNPELIYLEIGSGWVWK